MALHVGSKTPPPQGRPGVPTGLGTPPGAAWHPRFKGHRWWWLGALVLHASLVALAWQARPWQDRGSRPPSVVVPWRWLAATPTQGGRTTAAVRPAPARGVRPPGAAPPPAAAAPPQPVQAAAAWTPPAPSAETTAINAAALPASAASMPAPLNLALPRWRPGPSPAPGHTAGEAVHDPRANTPKPTVESRIAGVMGDGRWTVEALSDGRKRYRRGADCFVLQPARSGELNPFNASMYTPPPVAGAC